MGFDKIKIKQICFIIILIFVMIFLTINTTNVASVLLFIFDIISPFLIGGAIAFVIDIPMDFLENKWLKRWKGKWGKRLKRPICCILSVIIILTIITFIFALVISQLRKTTAELTEAIPIFIENCKDKCMELLTALQEKFPDLEKIISSVRSNKYDMSAIIGNVSDFLKNGLINILSKTVTTTSSIISVIVKVIIAFVFAVYILIQKEKLAYQFKCLFFAFLPYKKYRMLTKTLKLFSDIFRKFISGQCLEAIILGCMFVITMWIFRFPYAVFIGVVIAFTALVPIVGAFIGCAIGIFLIFIQSPIKAFWFIILFLALQQIEGNFIYPKVVGNSVGLPSIWVLVAISIGGSLFGIIGMLIFIPITSTLYSITQKVVSKRVELKLCENNKNS